jgi:four helix bundle protein
MLPYKRLDVYRCSIEFLGLTKQFKFPRGVYALRDQLDRAALSIPLNIAEAVGKPANGDRARYFAIARGSAMECGAILDSGLVLGVVDAQRVQQAECLLERIVAMLTKMCR